MTRLLLFLVHNWPLKLAAVVLSTLLYGVIILTQDARQQTVAVPISARNQAETITLLSNLGEVTRVRYIADDEVPVNSSSFIAWVDLGQSTVQLGTSSVRVHLEAVDDRIDIIDFEPQRISVTLEEVVAKRVPVIIDQGEVPEGLEVRPPVFSPEEAQVRGASSAIRQVDRVVARVQIEPSGLSFDRDVDLVPVDRLGNEVAQVEVEPRTAHVEVAVFNDRTTRTVPVQPDTDGQPAPGFEIGPITVDPPLVTLEGDADDLASVVRAETQPIQINGASGPIEQTIGLNLPPGVLPVGDEEVQVTIEIRPVTETRTYTAGVALEGARSDLVYDVSARSVLVVVGGSPADLDRLEGSSFQAELVVAGLEPGVHEIAVTADLPAGLSLLSSSPALVTVTITAPAGSSAAPAAPAASP
jgi:YbbR domain-containing protein